MAEKRENAVALYIKKEEIFQEKSLPKKFDKNGFDGGRYEVNVQNEPRETLNDTWKILKIDGEKLPKNAVFRFRKDGDKITVFGGKTKTLKKLFNEKKIPVAEREYLPLIAEENGEEVYVVCGVEISDKVKITQTTQQTLYIKTQKK
jgi:tRNA(Ile)-lysidine synthetase-like protein